MNFRRFVVPVVIAAGWFTPAFSHPLSAQGAATVPSASCRGSLPMPFAQMTAPSVVVRVMAEGEFPDADVAAARALVLLTRDLLGERGAVSLLTRINVERTIAPSASAGADVSGLATGSHLVTATVQRVRDSVTIVWRQRTIGGDTARSRSERVIVPIQELTRGALAVAEVATHAGAPNAPTLGAAAAPLPSVDASDAYVLGLAEALSPTPVSLGRARKYLVRATTLASSQADLWRWRARVEQMLIDWSTVGDAATMRGLRASALASSLRASKLAPYSTDAQVTLAKAYLGLDEREKAAAVMLGVVRRDPNSPAMQRVSALLDRIKGNDALALQQLRAAAQRAPRDAPLLVEIATLARLRGESGLACRALNAAIAADAELASAYALRAVVRADLGELREAWADAEVATRLGHPEWGERAAATLDAKYAERNQAVRRLRPLGGTAAMPINYLDALLLAQAARAVTPKGTPTRIPSGLACKALLRPSLLRDLQAIGVSVSDSCAPARGASASRT